MPQAKLVGDMDILSDLMQSVGMNPSLLTQNDVTGDWGILFSSSQSAGFHIVKRGECFLQSPALNQPIRLESNDLVFIARGVEHSLVSAVGIQAQPLAEFLRSLPKPDIAAGAKDLAVTTLVCGAYHFDVEPIHPFFNEIPEIVHFPSHLVSAQHPMHAALMLLSAELEQTHSQPGDTVVVKRLIDVMFCYILRQWMQNQAHSGATWMHAFYDENLRDSLIAIHENPAYPWSLQELAKISRLSRSAFAQRFKFFVNDTPINYLAKIRVQKAMKLLRKSEQSVQAIAEIVGYSTGFSLSKAFKRVCGISPQQYRQRSV